MSASDLNLDLALRRIAALRVPASSVYLPVASALYIKDMGGPAPEVFWGEPTARDMAEQMLETQRAEFYLVATSAVAVTMLLAKHPHNHDWRLEFDVGYLFLLKGLIQSIAAIEALCCANCYSDACAVIRTVHSRVNLLLLFSLGPHLHDEWLEFPKHEKFLDGHVREELQNHGIYTYPHLYEAFSEIAHAQFQALSESGYMERGLFSTIPAIANQTYVAAKLLFGIIGWVGLSVFRLDRELASVEKPEMEREIEALYRFLRSEMLAPSRIDHLWTMIAEERLWRKLGKNQYSVGDWFDYDEFVRQLTLFYRASRPKVLGKKYRLLTHE